MADAIELDAFKKEVEYLMGCCMKHPADFKAEDIEQCEAWVQSVPDEKSGFALFKMKDGRWASLEESQDYTGHG